jgi:AhpD family alkylhydroperoxidase
MPHADATSAPSRALQLEIVTSGHGISSSGQNANGSDKEKAMLKSRMTSPVMIVPEAMKAMQALGKASEQGGVPHATSLLMVLRASQINGCSVCVDMHARELKRIGESDERIFGVGAWRDAPYFTEAERAALDLTEALTRLADRPDPVPDGLWDEAARHYDERALSSLLLTISSINVWNRLNVATRQVAGEWMKSPEARAWIEKRAAATA